MKLKTQYPKIKSVLSHPITRFTLIALGSIAAYGELWSLLSYALYPKIGALYYPWDALMLALNHEANPQKINSILTLTFISPLIFTVWLCYRDKEEKELKTLHGDAHFATFSEMKKLGLFKQGDIFIGWHKGKRLMEKLVSHMLVFAPSRSGKGVSQVIPNALSFKGSLLVTDMKQEVYEYTSGFRAQHGQKVYLFAPANPNRKSHCWNPLDFVSEEKGQMIAEVQTIVEILIKKSGKETDSMWINEARAIAVGLLLWLKESGRPFTLGELNNLLKGTQNLSEFLKSILEKSIIADDLINMHPIAYMNINNFVQKTDKEQSGVKSTLTSTLSLWDDPYINAATAKSDFDIRKMREEPITIYLGIPPNQLGRLAPLMNLFIQQFCGLLSENLPQKEKEPYRILAILDEFCNLGKMEQLRKGFSYLAGYHVHLMTIIQNISEFYAIYGKNEAGTFFQNSEYKIMYRQNEVEDMELVSKLLGNKTLKKKSTSKHKGKNSMGGETTGETLIQRPLLLPQEVASFSEKHGLLKIRGAVVKFIRCIYYQEDVFKNRLLPAVVIPLLEPIFPVIKAQKKQEETEENVADISHYEEDFERYAIANKE